MATKRSPSTKQTSPTRSKSKTAAAGAKPSARKKTSSKTKAPKARSGVAKHPHAAAVAELRAFGLTYPEAHTKSPWPGHLDLAVKDKTFAYLSIEGEPLRISCKLPLSGESALSLVFTEPTAYGLGKSGWVTATFKDSEAPPVEFLKAWIDESYRAQAPKTLVKKLPST
ncbi:MAG TPA: MmcQ/YjbR family DNA-binding protein [Polyangiaceae bacterium]|jgi:predicted DNA-binding protein (MmcQ/YjbR family)|nr:MmcQ/YjbR family DNA-binding protein [Polyangiaceae bacterium]